jgi:tetratricopeptide (TPR) repeat protein
MIGRSRAEWLEIMMRLLPITLAAGLATALIASSGNGQTPDNQIKPESVALVRKGEAAMTAGQFQAADDAFETALAVDPRNRQAFIALARVAAKQKLYGQAIRYTNKALSLEPNDVDALALQGDAMVQLGATARAQQNLAKVRQLCGAKSCVQATTLAATIARGPVVAQKSPTPTPPAKQN